LKLHALSRHQVKAISFDLDDTLWPIAPVIRAAEQALQDWFAREHPQVSARFDLAGMRAVREEVAAEMPHLAHDLSAIRLRSIERLLVLGGSDSNMASRGFEAFYAARNRVELFPGALLGLERLAGHFRLFSLTNGNADLKQVGLAQHFELSFSARSMGFAKPDPRGFRAVAEAAGLKPEQVLHVGDHPEQDVSGALAAGMQAVWLNREASPWPGEGPEPVSVRCVASLAALLLA